MQSEIQVRKQRWRNFMAGESPHRYLYFIRFDPDSPARPWPWPDNVKQRIEWAWNKYCRALQQTTWLDDDTLPYLDVYTGTEIFAEAFGCSVHRPDGDMPAARPLIASASQVSSIRVPSLDTPCIARLFHIADELGRRAGKDALTRIVDIQSPMDIAALIWDKNDFYMAMIESPEAVRELAHKVNQFLTAFLDEWFTRYGREHIAHYPDYYMDGGWTVSEDEIGVVNEQMFLEYFLPELNALSDRYGGIAIHCCANSRHQWSNFRKIKGLRLMNICQPVEVIRQAYQFFEKDIVHWHGWNGDGDAWTWKDQHPKAARFIVDVYAKDRDEVLRLNEKLSGRGA